MGERRGVYTVLVGKPEGKRPLGTHRRRWEDNIKMDLQEVECVGIDWIDLTQDRDRWRALVNAVMKSLFFHRACCYRTLFKNPTHALCFKIHTNVLKSVCVFSVYFKA